MVIIRPPRRIFSVSKPVHFALLSDLHIGAATTDMAAIRADLKQAETLDARILINGDVFDAIVPKDSKRFRPDVLAPSLRGRADVLDGALKMAIDLLAPYAGRIDMIGVGNHESAVEKYHATDMVARLIRALRRAGGAPNYGGTAGYVDSRFGQASRSCNSRRIKIYYHHGSGGSAPVTKGMIDFARRGVWVDSDIVWLGHKHNRILDSTVMRMRCPFAGDAVVYDPQVFVMTGGYRRPCTQTSERALSRGRQSDYAEERGLAPQQLGGAIVRIEFARRVGIRRIQVLM